MSIYNYTWVLAKYTKMCKSLKHDVKNGVTSKIDHVYLQVYLIVGKLYEIF